jgi:hypothetical protein
MLRKEKMGGIYGQRRRDLYWQYCRISEWILISFLERIQDFYSNPVIRSSCKMISAKLQRSALQVVSQQKTLFFVFYIAGEI